MQLPARHILYLTKLVFRSSSAEQSEKITGELLGVHVMDLHQEYYTIKSQNCVTRMEVWLPNQFVITKTGSGFYKRLLLQFYYAFISEELIVFLGILYLLQQCFSRDRCFQVRLGVQPASYAFFLLYGSSLLLHSSLNVHMPQGQLTLCLESWMHALAEWCLETFVFFLLCCHYPMTSLPALLLDTCFSLYGNLPHHCPVYLFLLPACQSIPIARTARNSSCKCSDSRKCLSDVMTGPYL